MAAGLRIRNQDTGLVQIGTGYRNLELIQSGVMNTSAFIGGGDIRYSRTPSGFLMSTLGNDYLHVVRFVSDTIGAASGYGISQENNSVKVCVFSNSPTKSLEYYTFGYSGNQPSGPVGLRMRNEDGTVIYDSRRKPLRVLAAVPLPNTTGPLVYLGQFFPGTKIGLALANPRYYYRSPYPEICSMATDFLHMDSANNVHLSVGQVWNQNRSTAFTVGDTVMANQDAVMLVIDLTEMPLGFTA